jgi:uncharacterized phage protein (TIGR02218 family)
MTLGPHLALGLTTIARAWAVTRRDGVTLGFTDHDMNLTFEGITFRADTGMEARALVQGTGLAVDNSEALGVLSDAAISDAEIEAGRFDGAEVRMWLVNWADVAQRMLRFRGTLGEIRRGDGAFHAELRGLTDALNQPQGRVFHRQCSAVLGDLGCGFDLDAPGYAEARAAEVVERGQMFRFARLDGFVDRWFERGMLRVQGGAAAGLTGVIKQDRLLPGGAREITLWEPLRATLAPGDLIRLDPGCDKRAETCRFKFNNLLNFRGFPFIPGDDWLTSVPRGDGTETGGSLMG